MYSLSLEKSSRYCCFYFSESSSSSVWGWPISPVVESDGLCFFRPISCGWIKPAQLFTNSISSEWDFSSSFGTVFTTPPYYITKRDQLTIFLQFCTYSTLSTVIIWIPDKSGIQMVQTCLVVKWSGFWVLVWKPGKNVCFRVKNVWFLNNLPNHIVRPFETCTKNCPKSECSYFRCSVFRWLLYFSYNSCQITFWYP